MPNTDAFIHRLLRANDRPRYIRFDTRFVPREDHAPETVDLAVWNDLDSVKSIFESANGEVGAVAIEPLSIRMGGLMPLTGFLNGVRELCDRHGAVLLFDETLTGLYADNGLKMTQTERIRNGALSAPRWSSTTCPQTITPVPHARETCGIQTPNGAYFDYLSRAFQFDGWSWTTGIIGFTHGVLRLPTASSKGDTLSGRLMANSTVSAITSGSMRRSSTD
ncbi:MAG: aminotransferase class III-fold pyridoxal phosphate-dependent enzyme [Candidatus Lokiarchaeota archaeon]|nr:aminotransferase class III-fold pyridoxal phosphate-dependent enzyme [Candidatus Lokiarchaeota archaeon]MBD3239288.1 aminotransferase class III-fold pyridoxal phosphate-dependent enzyme [Chitinivibrionales bacterium]